MQSPKSQVPTPHGVCGTCRVVRTCRRSRSSFPADVSIDSRCDPKRYAERLDRARTRACDAHLGIEPGRHRNRTCAVLYETAAAGAVAKTRQCGERRMF